MKIFDETMCVYALVRLDYSPENDLWKPAVKVEPAVYFSAVDASNAAQEEDFDCQIYRIEEPDCPVKNLHSKNVYGNPIDIFVYKFLDYDYDYSKDGILVCAIYKCERSIGVTLV